MPVARCCRCGVGVLPPAPWLVSALGLSLCRAFTAVGADLQNSGYRLLACFHLFYCHAPVLPWLNCEHCDFLDLDVSYSLVYSLLEDDDAWCRYAFIPLAALFLDSVYVRCRWCECYGLSALECDCCLVVAVCQLVCNLEKY